MYLSATYIRYRTHRKLEIITGGLFVIRDFTPTGPDTLIAIAIVHSLGNIFIYSIGIVFISNLVIITTWIHSCDMIADVQCGHYSGDYVAILE